MDGNNKEEKEGFGGKTALIAELGRERVKILQALREIGYYAYRVEFVPFGKYTPTIKIGARGWDEDDKELIEKEQKKLEELISNS